MVKEESSGGIVYRFKKGEVEVLLLKDMNNNWTFPKGLVEKAEPVENAARREISEETGIHNLVLKDKIDNVTYWYKRNTSLIYKTVHYYLFQTDGNEKPKPQKEEFIQEVRWVPLDESFAMIGYPETNKPLLEKTQKLLKRTIKTP